MKRVFARLSWTAVFDFLNKKDAAHSSEYCHLSTRTEIDTAMRTRLRGKWLGRSLLLRHQNEAWTSLSKHVYCMDHAPVVGQYLSRKAGSGDKFLRQDRWAEGDFLYRRILLVIVGSRCSFIMDAVVVVESVELLVAYNCFPTTIMPLLNLLDVTERATFLNSLHRSLLVSSFG